MKQFTYTVKDPLGIHARPAGMLAKAAKAFTDTSITVTKGAATVKASQLMKLMSLAVKQGDSITLSCDGASEDAAMEAMVKLLTENL